MPQPRNLRHDLAVLGLFALTVFLGLSLLTFDAADPPGNQVYPPPTQVANLCGPPGAFAASALFRCVGFGAYYALGWLTFVLWLAWQRQPVDTPFLRAIGWNVSFFGLVVLLAYSLPVSSPGSVLGAGGYIGAAGQAVLQQHFSTPGAVLLLLGLIMGGLLLATDYFVFRASRQVMKMPAGSMRSAMDRAKEYAVKKLTQDKRIYPIESTLTKPLHPDAALAVKSGVKVKRRLIDEPKADGLLVPAAASLVGAAAPAVAQVLELEHAEAEEAPENIRGQMRIRHNRQPSAREAVDRTINESAGRDGEGEFSLPPLELLAAGESFQFEEQEREVREKARLLEEAFHNFGLKVSVVEIETGPVIAQYEVELEAGLRLSKITSLADDLAIALRVPSVRIVAPIPGKNTVGIEVPNSERQLVRLREVIEEADPKTAKMRIPIYLGKDVAGNPMIVDLSTLPHLLIAGRTGTGKSVCLNTIIMSMLMSRGPDEVKMLLIDPKMVELTPYMKLPHLMHPVVTDMKKAEAILAWAVDKMEERYALLAKAGVRHLAAYNQLGEDELMERFQPETDEERDAIPLTLPYIVIVADEMADLMMTSAKEVETYIIRLAQKSRAVGIHLVLATQKPTVDVITGLIKSNLPARISFQVASRTDSRVVLDEMGADKLLGNGDLLFLWPGTSMLLRGQGAYISDEEINRVVAHVGTTEPQFVSELVHLPAAGQEEVKAGGRGQEDELYSQAVEIVLREGRGSVSLLQRALGIGYGRAARLIDYMADDGLVGQYNGSQAREVLVTVEDWLARHTAMTQGAAKSPAPAGASSRKKHVVTFGRGSERVEAAGGAAGRVSHAVPWDPHEVRAAADDGEMADDEPAPVRGRGTPEPARGSLRLDAGRNDQGLPGRVSFDSVLKSTLAVVPGAVERFVDDALLKRRAQELANDGVESEFEDEEAYNSEIAEEDEDEVEGNWSEEDENAGDFEDEGDDDESAWEDEE